MILSAFLVIGVAYGIAYWLASTGAAYWRAVLGFLVAFVIAWIGGGYLTAEILFPSGGAGHSMSQLIARSMLWALVAAGYGVYRGRLKVAARGNSIKPSDEQEASLHPTQGIETDARTGEGRLTENVLAAATTSKPIASSSNVSATTDSDASEEVWSAAIAELEGASRRPGLWARAFSEAQGNESLAKANYLRYRASELQQQHDAHLEQAQRDADEVARTAADALRVAKENADATKVNPIAVGGINSAPGAVPNWVTQAMLVMAGVAVVGIIAAVALPAYQDYARRQASSNQPVQAPAAAGPWSEFTPVHPVANSAPIQSQDQQPYSISLEKAVAAIEREIDSAYNYQLLSMVTDIEIRYPVFRTEAGQVASRRLKAQIDEKMAGLARPAPQKRETQQQQTKVIPKQPAVPSAASIPESEHDRAYRAKVEADLKEVSQRALSDYPYLNTSAGKEVLDKIVRRRDELIKNGIYPSIALTRAVNDFAPAYAPVATKEGGAAQSTESVRPESHNAFPPGCRWVTPKDWSCK